MGKLGIIGGTSLFKSSMFSSLHAKTVSTPHGDVILHCDSERPDSVVFLQRHHADGAVGKDVYQPPHLVNFRANMAAMAAEGVDKIIAVCCVGSLSKHIQIGTVVIPDDYVYMSGPSVSYYDDARAHIVPSIDVHVRAELIEILNEEDALNLRKEGAVYVQTVGPRFETKAEVRFLSSLGDIIGMTGATEATLAKELAIPYAILAMVDNMANGLAEAELSKEQFNADVARNMKEVERCVAAVLKRFDPGSVKNGLTC